MSATILRGPHNLCDVCHEYRDPLVKGGWLPVQICLRCVGDFKRAAGIAARPPVRVERIVDERMPEDEPVTAGD